MKNHSKVTKFNLGRICAFCMVAALTVTGISANVLATDVKADTQRGRSCSWYGGTFDASMVDSVSYLNNVNMHSGNVGISLSDSAYTYGPLQSTRRYAYVKVDFSDEYSPERDILSELKNANIEYAYLKLIESQNSSAPGIVDFESPVADWNPLTITFSNKPEVSGIIWAREQCKGVKNTQHNIDITNWVRSIVNGTIQNYGLVMRQENKKTANSFYGGVEKEFAPKIYIGYTINE